MKTLAVSQHSASLLQAHLSSLVPDTKLASSEVLVNPRILTDGMCFSLLAREDYCKAFTYGLHDLPSDQACVEIIQQDPDHDLKLFTGFALNHGNLWIPHSFIVEKDSVVEPCNELFLCYVGVELTGQDKADFMSKWGH